MDVMDRVISGSTLVLADGANRPGNWQKNLGQGNFDKRMKPSR